MRIVISCSSQDHSWAELLGARLQQAGLEVWLDRDLAAGQVWWDTVLAQLRSCDAVVVGVSRAYLNSRACRDERAYAESLGKPVLPVVIESIDAAMLPPDLARLQFVDYSRPEAGAFRLIGAIIALPATQSLPDPLPAPPPIPVSYLSAVAARLTSPSLSLDDQLEIIDMLEGAVNAAAPDDRRDATELLRELARRPDLYARAARRIESLLEPDDAANRPSESFDRLYGGHPAVDAGGTGMPSDPAPPRGTAGPKLVDFDMAIVPISGGYRTRVASPAGDAYADFDFPFTDQDLEILILKVSGSIGRARRQARRIESPERLLLETFGRRLFQAVFWGPVRDCLGHSRLMAEAQGAGVRIRLQVPGELANVPWEYLYDDQYGFLCLSPETALVRYVDMPGPVQSLPFSTPLRILAMIAAPRDLPELQGEEEWAKLCTALGDLTAQGTVQVDRLPAGTLSDLQRPLRLHDYHVLHFIGHGLYDEEAQDGALALEGAGGRTRLVTGRDIGMMIRGHRSLRLVVLNACQGARSARDDPFGGVAQALVRQGVPAVIAMQFEISDPAALVFSQSFYQAIADGLPVDEATVEARRAIFAAGNEVEWATPVVYLRSPDGRVFRKDPSQPRQGTEPAADNAAAARHQPAQAFTQTNTGPEPSAREPAADQTAVPAPFPPPFGQSQEPEAGEAKVFISYSHRDTRYRQQLQTHLSALRRQGVLAEWHDHKILPGEEWRDAIDRNLDAADCVVLLVTPDFIASDYCYSIEMDRALAKHREGRGLVIPVIVRPADWQHTPLSDLEALPEGAKPVVEWASRDRAWLSVADGVRLALASSARAKPGRKARGGDTREAQDDADLALLEQQARSSGQEGNAASARDQYAALLPAYERILGPQHPETLKARGSLARWTGRAGDLASGRDQYAALLPAYERVLGPEHPETLNTRNSLAWFTGHAGDPAGARDQLAALLPTDERVLGPEHAYTLAARNNLAHFTGAAGDPASARDQYAALVPVMERVLGPDNPETLAARSSLADWSTRTRSGHDDPTDALEREAASSRSQREIAALKEFDVPADKGLTRVQASEALKRHGIDPKAFGPWVRHGWVIRDGDRRYLSPKGRQWLTDNQTSP